jgi:hypothetical protein
VTVFGLHRTVLLLAATHFIVDGYGNILAPLLPLIITNLNLSLFAAGDRVVSDDGIRLGYGRARGAARRHAG